MATNLHLDDALIDEAVSLGRHGSKREAVDAALVAYVSHLRRVAGIERFGTFDFDPAYDPRAGRRDRDSR